MKKIIVSLKRISREFKSNPHQNEDMHSRLVKSSCVDYRGNFFIVNFGNGYAKIVAKNDKKIFT